MVCRGEREASACPSEAKNENTMKCAKLRKAGRQRVRDAEIEKIMSQRNDVRHQWAELVPLACRLARLRFHVLAHRDGVVLGVFGV